MTENTREKFKPRGGSGGGFMNRRRRRPCGFCVDKTQPFYRDIGRLRNAISNRGKIIPKRQSGICPKHQRALATAVKQARSIGLMPFVVD
jgi:small subunit ribosomal protein S18